MLNIFSQKSVAVPLVAFILSSALAGVIYAQVSTSFSITIGQGTLSVRVADSGGTTVASPSVSFSSYSRSDSCGEVTATLGTTNQVIRVHNNHRASNGWNLTLDGSATASWVSGANNFDYNDPGNTGALGCSDLTTSGDTDTFAGQLTVSTASATRAGIGSSSLTGVSLGSGGSFVEGTTDSVTLLSGSSGAANPGEWSLIGVDLTQKIPASQAQGTYALSLTLTVTAL